MRFHGLDLDLGSGQCLVLDGAREAALALARTLVAEAVVAHPAHVVRLDVSEAAARTWAWTRWLPHLGLVSTGSADTAVLTVCQPGPGGAPCALYCGTPRVDATRRHLHVRPHRRDAWVRVSRGGRRPVPMATMGPAVAEQLARLLAARETGTDVPTLRHLAEVWGPHEIVRAWRQPTLAVPLGLREGGTTFTLDLPLNGPHLLVAGTTGAGKSQFLRTLVLSLAVHNSPQDLTVVALDHKGGATFGDLRGLPHLAALVTDLDLASATRALTSIKAELRRRERVLAMAACHDLGALRAAGGHLPSLVIVVDEFRALSDDLPDFVDSLVRLAAQGRALGMHLVLATQRPGGAISADMRANISARVCCRVADTSDSLDVVGVPDAAHLRTDSPGSAIAELDGQRISVQIALGDTRAGRVLQLSTWPENWAGRRPSRGDDARLVADISRAAALAAIPSAPPLWLDPLPSVVAADDLAGVPPSTTVLTDALPLALGDRPEELSRTRVSWEMRSGHLLIAGTAGSGRTTAALALACQGLNHSLAVHVACANPEAFAHVSTHKGFGTLLDPHDVRRLSRLLDLLAQERRPTMLVVDDADTFVSPDTPAGELMRTRLLRPGASPVHVVLAGSPGLASGRLGSLFPNRLVLRTAEVSDDLALGIPRQLAIARTDAGRAVWRDAYGAIACQVALPPALLTTEPGPQPPRLVPIPLHVDLAELPDAVPPAFPIGRGGDTAGIVSVDLGPGDRLLVAGPPGCGRSALARLLARRLAAAGQLAAALYGDDPGLGEALGGPVARSPQPPSGGPLPGAAHPADRRGEPNSVVVIDDLTPAVPLPAVIDPSLAIVATCRMDHLQSPGHGLLAAVASVRCWVVLGHPGALALQNLGASAAVSFDPAHPRHPGRGALLTPAGAVPLQCAESR